jgi:hypothetical protein
MRTPVRIIMPDSEIVLPVAAAGERAMNNCVADWPHERVDGFLSVIGSQEYPVSGETRD